MPETPIEAAGDGGQEARATAVGRSVRALRESSRTLSVAQLGWDWGSEGIPPVPAVQGFRDLKPPSSFLFLQGSPGLRGCGRRLLHGPLGPRTTEDVGVLLISPPKFPPLEL